MTKEDYVSLEVAKKLKEKGFNEPCYKMFNEGEECYDYSCYTTSKRGFRNSDLCAYEVAIPTLYDAQKWLRTRKKIHVNADYEVYREKWFFSLCLINPDKFNQFEDMSESNYNSYEEALNSGILESLNYI